MNPLRILLLPALSFAFSTLAADAAAPPEKANMPHHEAPEKKAGEPPDKKEGAMASGKEKEAKDASQEKPKEEKPKEKAGRVTLGGADIRYIAQTGMLPVLKDDGTPRANVFYVYYAAADAEGKRLASRDGASRPITFCFNGGPGASA